VTALQCEVCDAATDAFARGWRAYAFGGAVVVVCPDCAELCGEDETPATAERADATSG
jgi:hypothetical protein